MLASYIYLLSIAFDVQSASVASTDMQFISDFKCPETYSGPDARSKGYSEFDGWVIKHHPTWTVDKLALFRYSLLELHECTETLANLRQKEGFPQQTGEYVAEKLLPPSPQTENCLRPAVREMDKSGVTKAKDILALHDKAESSKNALNKLMALATKGDGFAEFYLATLYDPSLGSGAKTVVKDWKLADLWYLKAAKQGLPEAEYSLGNSYANGAGLVADPAQAVNWYRLAGEHGYVAALWNMGVAYEFGLGIKADADQAQRWYCAAALTGDPQSQWHMVALYYQNWTPIRLSYWLNVLLAEGDQGAPPLLEVLGLNSSATVN